LNFGPGPGAMLQNHQSLAMRALGLDVGSKTIGLALSDAGGVVATAQQVLRRSGQVEDARAVVQEAVARGASRVVVGWPLELDGRVGHRARRVQAFVDALRDHADQAGMTLQIELWDERFSTAAAERTLLEADVSRRKRKQVIDALAAQFILQGWLDAQSRGTSEVEP
jgi:putative Holliday junction resolvase